MIHLNDQFVNLHARAPIIYDHHLAHMVLPITARGIRAFGTRLTPRMNGVIIGYAHAIAFQTSGVMVT